MSRQRIATRFGELFFAGLVGRTAESVFKQKVAEFCTDFTPAHVKKVAESGVSLQQLIARSGFNLKPTPASQLNPWQRHFLSLPEARLLELVKEASSPAHAEMLDRYPQVARQLIQVVKNMVVPG